MSAIPAPLREEVKVRRFVQQGDVSFVVKEPDKQEYYRFSVPQMELIKLFDGVHDLTAIVERFNEISELYEFDVDAAESVYHACKDYQILKRSRQEENVALLERIKDERKKSLIQAKGSVLMMRFQLVNPNSWFDSIIESIRFMWSPKALKLQAGFILLAFITILFSAERFAQDFTQVYLQTQISGVIYIWIIALCAIALHECGHGLTCKYYGGDVHEMGFLLLCFQPCLYCNVNDAWLFENKTHKIQVALAGVWVELLLAALATMVWLLVDVYNPIGYIAFVLMTIGTASSLLVNLNPLLKFDGYYILTDWLEMQNLRQNALTWFSWNLKTTLFNSDEEKPFNPTPREKRVYWIYGSAVAVYMTLMLSFIAWLGYQFVYSQLGFFAILGFIYLAYRLIKSITGNWLMTIVQWTRLHLWEGRNRKIRTLICGLTALLIVVFWQPNLTLYSDGEITADTRIVYSPANAFVVAANYTEKRKLDARSGESFLQMASPELMMLKQDLEARQMELQGKKVASVLENESSSQARLAIELGLVAEKLLSTEQKISSLQFSAPEGNWSVEGLSPELIQGRFFAEQQEVLRLLSEDSRYFDAIVDQRDVSYLSPGDRAKIVLNAQLSDVLEAQVQLISALAKSDGVEQKVLVRMVIKDWDSDVYLPVGISGEAKIYGEKRPLWQHVVFKIRKFFRADLWL